jgi:HD-GYP domain-containing protein (c-di-GMP phosphodiesterase class II)
VKKPKSKVIRGPQFDTAQLDAVPAEVSEASPDDLYVLLPKNRKYVLWIQEGDAVEERHVEGLARHGSNVFFSPSLAARRSNGESVHSFGGADESEVSDEKRFQGEKTRIDLARLEVTSGTRKREALEIKRFSAQSESDTAWVENSALTRIAAQISTPTEALEDDNVESPVAKDIQNFYRSVIGNTQKVSVSDAKLDVVGDKILQVVAPEVLSMKSQLQNIEAYIAIMEGCTAVLAIASLAATATGQRSRAIYKDLAYACLLMDISTAELGADFQKRMVCDPKSLDEVQQREISEHPRKSIQILQRIFSNLPDLVSQMVMGHHELFSGEGYPRRVRSEMLAPMVRILAFGVDAYETMARAKHRGEELSLQQVVESFASAEIEPHRRRHNLALLRSVLKSIQEIEAPIAEV